MRKRVRRLVQRTDLLLISLCLLVSLLFSYRFGAMDTVAQPAEAPDTLVHDTPSAQEPELAPQTPAKAGAPVRFLMFNTKNYFVAEDVKRSPARHQRKIKPVAEREKVADVIASVQPEVVGLIEIGGPAALDDLAKRLAARGLYYHHRKVLTRWGEDRALAILSRHEIAEDNSIADCKLLGNTRRPMLRGILDVTLLVKGEKERRFRIMGVHLKSRMDPDPSMAQSLRAREARTLMAHVQAALRAHPERPLLIYGDWNDGPADPALAGMTKGTSRETTLHRLTPTDSRGEGWTIYYKEGNEYSTFDQIYVNHVLYRNMKGRNKSDMGIVSEEKGKGAPASDHRAVWCDMR